MYAVINQVMVQTVSAEKITLQSDPIVKELRKDK